MSRDAVVAFLNDVAQDPSLRSDAQDVYRGDGLDGLVRLGADRGNDFTADELESVISPAEISSGALGTSIGWS